MTASVQSLFVPGRWWWDTPVACLAWAGPRLPLDEVGKGGHLDALHGREVFPFGDHPLASHLFLKKQRPE